MTAPSKPPVEITSGPVVAGISLAPGTPVRVHGQPGTIVAELPLNEVLVRDKAKDLAEVRIEQSEFQGAWNYSILPKAK